MLAYSSRGPIVFTYVLSGLKKTLEDFQFSRGNPSFWNLQNVLFNGTGGTGGTDGTGGTGGTVIFFVLQCSSYFVGI